MKATNIVKHSNIVDREKRSEALGTGKLFLTFLLCLVSLSLSPVSPPPKWGLFFHSEPTPNRTTPYQPWNSQYSTDEWVCRPVYYKCDLISFLSLFHIFFTKATAGSYIMSKI